MKRGGRSAVGSVTRRNLGSGLFCGLCRLALLGGEGLASLIVDGGTGSILRNERLGFFGHGQGGQ